MIGLIKILGILLLSILLIGYIEKWYLSLKDKKIHSKGGSATLDYPLGMSEQVRQTLKYYQPDLVVDLESLIIPSTIETTQDYVPRCGRIVSHKNENDFTLYGICGNQEPCKDHGIRTPPPDSSSTMR